MNTEYFLLFLSVMIFGAFNSWLNLQTKSGNMALLKLMTLYFIVASLLMALVILIFAIKNL